MIAALLLALAAVQAAPITCKTGPIDHSFGGTEWSVFACSDGRSIIARAKPGNPADPFYFIIAATGEAYEVYGEGTGEKAASDAAYEELRKLVPAEVAKLHAQATAATPIP
jgi:hypothetical protein